MARDVVVRRYRFNEPGVGMQCDPDAPRRLTVSADGLELRWRNHLGDVWPAGDPNNKGARSEANFNPDLTGIKAGGFRRAFIGHRLRLLTETTKSAWSALAQGHQKGSGQAVVFVCTPGGYLHVRGWDLLRDRQAGLWPVVDATGRKVKAEPGMDVTLAYEVVVDQDPARGGIHVLANGVEVCDARFSTADEPGEAYAVKEGFYRQRFDGPPVVEGIAHAPVRVTGADATMDDLLGALGVVHVPPTAPPPSIDPCAALRVELASSASELLAARAEVASFVAQREALVLERDALAAWQTRVREVVG